MAARKRELAAVAPARPDFLILGLAAAGFAIAAYLTGLKWMGGNAAFCLSGSGCDVVQASRYGNLLGVPTALWGVLLYAAIGALAALGLTAPRWTWALYLAAAGVGFSIYLTAVSVLVIKATCAYCLASGAITVATLFVLLRRRGAGAARRRLHLRGAGGRGQRLRGRARAAPAREGRGDVRGPLVPALHRAEGPLRRRGQGRPLRGVRRGRGQRPPRPLPAGRREVFPHLGDGHRAPRRHPVSPSSRRLFQVRGAKVTSPSPCPLPLRGRGFRFTLSPPGARVPIHPLPSRARVPIHPLPLEGEGFDSPSPLRGEGRVRGGLTVVSLSARP